MNIALIVCIVGAVIYIVAKAVREEDGIGFAELGRLAFVAGLLAFLLKG